MSGVQTPPPVTAREADARVAVEVKAFQAAGRLEDARERFAELVTRHQRRAARIAYHYLRDAADADEAVQDAFIKVFLHIDTYRDELSFDVWFMRILVNACLDRLKSRSRQQRWMTSPIEEAHESRPLEQAVGTEPSTEHQMLVRERWERMLEAVAGLPDRQRLVFTLSHLDERTAGEISASTGMSPATVRVHLFRAIRKLRAVLGDEG